MHPNAGLIDRFYSAFAAGDHETMARCYSNDAGFTDPVFGDLSSEQVRAMWRMFCTSGNDLAVSHGDVRASDGEGAARWEAVYAFPRTGRRVHNKITARFTFSQGKIARHVDSFDLYRWARMALGPIGVLLGWTPIVQNQVRSRAMAQLERFMREEAGSS